MSGATAELRARVGEAQPADDCRAGASAVCGACRDDGENRLKYTRVYADEEGESHFEDVEVGMSEVVFAPPAPPLRLSEFMESSRFSFLSAQPGWFGDWHPAPSRQFMLHLQGEVEAEVSDGEIRRFGPGSATLVEDTSGKGHRSRVVGEQEVLLAVVQLDT